MSRLTPEQRTLRAKAAAHSLHAKGGTNTEAARAARVRRFEDQVDPDRVLTPQERAKRAAHAEASYMTSLSLKSSKARSKGVE